MSVIAPLLSDAPSTTERYGRALGAALRRGDVLLLEGALGAGKTCLVRGIVGGAGGDPGTVRSPTFVLHQPHRGASLTVHHIDLYRLGAGASIEVLDLDAHLRDGAAVIEWGGFADLSDVATTTVSISGGDGGGSDRVLHLHPTGARHLVRAWAALQTGAAVR